MGSAVDSKDLFATIAKHLAGLFSRLLRAFHSLSSMSYGDCRLFPDAIVFADYTAYSSVRYKQVLFKSFQTGRDILLPLLPYQPTLHMTGCHSVLDSPHDYFHVADNSLRDWSSYYQGVLKFQTASSILLVNSSCPPLFLKRLLSFPLSSLPENSIIGPGICSLYKTFRFNINIVPHLQSYCLLLHGNAVVKYFLEFVSSQRLKFPEPSKMDLIRFFEIEFTRHRLGYRFNSFYISPSNKLIKIAPYSPFYGIPLLDSRLTNRLS